MSFLSRFILIIIISFLFCEDSIIINEINYNSNDTLFNPEDWVEFYNKTDSQIDISNWYFVDEVDTHIFVFPQMTIIESHGFLVLAKQIDMFENLFPNVENVIGNIGFGIAGGGELLRLYNSNDILVDSLTYDDVDPWPTDADGDGPTLELINPSLDNALSSSWQASFDFGSPGEVNSQFLNNNNNDYSTNYSIESVYPNPFNPKITIKYMVDKPSFIIVSVYNLFGQKIENIFNSFHLIGQYQISWDATNYTSGIYFIKLESKYNSVSTKISLIK